MRTDVTHRQEVGSLSRQNADSRNCHLHKCRAGPGPMSSSQRQPEHGTSLSHYHATDDEGRVRSPQGSSREGETVSPISTALGSAAIRRRLGRPATGGDRALSTAGIRTAPPRTRVRATGLALGVAALAALGAPSLASAAVNNPPVLPHSIIAFPQRDFVSADGFTGESYTVDVIHPDGTTRSTGPGIAPKNGVIEVNHPGGVCWQGVTPDIRPGDKVRITNNADGSADETTVANVTAKRPVQTGPGSVEIHGTALDAAGNPLPVDQIEQRLVDPDLFDLNGRRTLRAANAAGEDGTLSYDLGGLPGDWTARYTLSDADVTKALASESRGIWLGAAPAAGNELTIYENGGGITAGPSAPCTAPLEKLPPPPGSELEPPSTPANLTGKAAAGSVSLSWVAAQDNVGVTDYGVYRDGVAIATVQNAEGTAPAPTTFVDKNVKGTHTYTIDAGDAVGNRSLAKSNEATGTALDNPAPALAATDHDPPVAPHSFIAFPSRDFVSADGYTPGTTYTFSVVRGGNIVSTSTPVVADSAGLAEVNHPGGGCWEGVTPNIRPGDQIRITGGGVTEQTSVAGVTAERPIVTAVDSVTGGGTVVVHGTAQDAAGNPLPVDQIEQRLVAPNDQFDINGRRTIRAANAAGEDGTLSYDAPGSTKWTATYTLQTPNDLARAVGGKSTSGAEFAGAESRVLWLGRDTAAGTELTIYENGPAVTGGPAAGIDGCVSGLAETPAANVALSAAPKFATTTVGGTSAVRDVTITNTGDAPLNITRAYLAGLNPDQFKITTNVPADMKLPANGAVTVTVTFNPTASGTKQANLSFADDAANTADQTVPLVASTPPAAGGTATGPIQSLAAGQTITNAAGKVNSTIELGLQWTATGSRSELQMSLDNGRTWGAPPVGTELPVGATSTTVKLKMGSVNGTGYQFRVRSCDATACGAYASGPAFTLQPADENGFLASAWKGNWTTDAINVPNAYGGTVRWAAGSAQATIVDRTQFTVSGNAAWVSTLGPDRGQAQVQIDNGKPDVVDLYSPTVQQARVAWAKDALPPGQHTVTVTVLGKRSTLNPAPCNTGTKCARVDVDAAVVIK